MSGAAVTASREARAHPRHDLEALLAPRSIAFVGASERANAPASRGLRHCVRLGFSGPLYAINPKHAAASAPGAAQLFGVPCLPTLDALPAAVDLAVIALPAAATLQAVADCERLGVRAAVICSSGWGEGGDEEGLARQAELRALLAQARLRVLGPNCIGVGAAMGTAPGTTATPYFTGFNSSFEHLAFRHRRPIGVVCQSGAMLGGLLLNGEDTGTGVEAFIHVGNGLDISLEEAGRALLARPEVRTLAMLVEGLSDGRAFVALAHEARALGKRIAVFKAGASEVGRQAVQSHTGALAGSDELFSAVCADEGVVRVEEPEDLLPVARALCAERNPAGRRVLVYTLSGGGASVLADELERQGLAVPAPTGATVQACDALGDPFIRASNPFDVGSSVFSNPDAAGAALKIAAADPCVDAIAWIGVGAPRDERSNHLLGQALDALAGCGKPAVVLPLSGTPVEPGFARAHALDIPVARSARSAALLLRHALHGAPPDTAQDSTGSVTAQHLHDDATPTGTVMNEAQAREELARAGLPMLSAPLAADAAALDVLAAQANYPVVLKGLVPGIAHKTEAGLVALRLADAAAVRAAAQAMAARHGTALRGYTLEPMLEGGIETVIGVRFDPQFGPMLMFGLGGTAVELFRDVAFTQCPCTPGRARRLVQDTRAWTLLQGFRGQPAGDLEALVQAMVRLSDHAARHGDRLAEIEINPFIVLPAGRGALGVDALIIQRPPEAP